MGAALASVRDRVDTADNGIMLEIFQNFECAMGGAAQSSPLVLIGPGIAAVLAGLFVWLGGLNLRKILVGIIAAAGGCVFGFVVIGRGPVPAAASAAAAALVAIALERVFITVLAAALAAAFGFAVLAGPYMENSGAANSASRDEVSAETSTFGDGEVMEELRAYAVDVGGRARQAGSEMPAQRWAVIAALAAICVVGGFTLWRLTAALCFSTLGTMLILFGMTLLLLFKGSSPVGYVSDRPSVYAGVSAAMVVFGTIEQLVLCRRPQAGPAKKKKNDKENEDTGTKTRGWRTT
ncbi:MAG: hypothetical protein ABIF19_19715 [Planctomycetota bacterium]